LELLLLLLLLLLLRLLDQIARCTSRHKQL
jgi:hypothetical protein